MPHVPSRRLYGRGAVLFLCQLSVQKSFQKHLLAEPDIVCLELEDGIAPKDKNNARANALSILAEKQADDGVERMVRVNCLRDSFGIADLQAILSSPTPPPSLMLPKVCTPDEVAIIDTLLTEKGHEHPLEYYN
jgi:(S)-citramalyl-CoA lyase